MKRITKRRAFTILEITLVLGILVILIALTIVLSVNAIGRSSLQSTENLLVQTLRRAQSLAQNNVQGSPWGVYICTGPTPGTGCTTVSVVLFQGTTFDTFNPSTDQAFELNAQVTFAGGLYTSMIAGSRPGIAFEQITGEPSLNGVIEFALNGEDRRVTVSSKGLVEH